MGRWLKIGHKRAIIRMAEACPAMTQSELAAWVRKKFKLRAKPARNTISDIMKNAESIMSATYGDDAQRKPTQVSSPQLEKQLATPPPMMRATSP
ncbi:Eukaryotic peptide chain release factor GTP-binding subunit [Phytophthora cinnamomi]|uniref:Eukaryotic peptide chain release factor GTP-binding subunit n=1 Tax=Phytophthora cinnamomi TaxID=4785 RepID=UPI00355AC7C0|nr:Eukaryotic peptide chain release factor GTP-binding subunit [Phytophthora cinnamomi]